MTFFEKLKVVLDHYHIEYDDEYLPMTFNIGEIFYSVDKEGRKYRVARQQGNCIYKDYYDFAPSQFNDFADILLEDLPDDY